MKHKSRVPFFLWILTAALTAVVFYLRLNSPDLCWFNTHMARDLMRAQDWIHGHPDGWLGPELNIGGGRLFGPAFYWIIAFFWQITGSLPRLLFSLHAVTILISLAFCFSIKKDLGWNATAVFFFLFILMPVHVAVSRTLWNPSLIVPINLGFLLCTASYCRHPHSRPPLVVLGALGILGLQIHLATLPGFFSCVFVVALQTKRTRGPLLCTAALLVFLLAVVVASGNLTAFSDSLAIQYGLENRWGSIAQYIQRWYYHVFVTETPIGDYELFPVLIRTGEAILPQRLKWLTDFFLIRPFIIFLYAVSFFLCLGNLIFSRLKNRRAAWYTELVVTWNLLTIVPLYFYAVKSALPYRYGLALYPAQFLAMAVAWKLGGDFLFRRRTLSSLTPWIYGLGPALGLLIFVGNAVFLDSTYRVMAASGKASHVNFDSSEIPLRHKLELIKLALYNAPESELYRYLHGRIPNKIRQKEFDWDFTHYYGALPFSLGRTLSPPTIYPRRHYFIDPLTGYEMSLNARTGAYPLPFHLVELLPTMLPQNLTCELLDKRGERLSIQKIKDGELIQPFLNLGPARDAVTARFHFDLNQAHARTFVVTYDSSPYRALFTLESVKLHGKPVPFEIRNSAWLQQTLAAIALPLPSAAPLNYEMTFRLDPPNSSRYSRLDIFEIPEQAFID